MSPFATFLRKIRRNRGFRQNELAHHLGYEPSYLSALERGEKGPPRQDFIARFIRELSLSGQEQDELKDALKSSRRQFFIPRSASDAEFQLVHQLEPQLGNLHPLQVQLIQLALSMSQTFRGTGESYLSIAKQEVRNM